MSSNDRTTKRTEAVSKKEIEALRSRLHNLQQKQKQTTNTNSDVLSEKTASSASSHHQHSKPLPVHVNSRGEHPPSNQHEMPAKLAVDLVPPPSEPVAESTELRPPQRGKPYDQDAARDFMRKQQLKRHAEKLNELKKIEQTVDLRKQRLKELQQKTRKIVETNLIRSRSKSRERSTANLTVEAEVHAHDERRKAVAVVDNATKPPSNSSKAAAKLAIQSRNITVRRRYDAEVPTKASDHIPVVVVTAHDVLNKSATTIQAAYRRYKHQQSLSTKSREPSKKYFPPAIESWQPNAPESTTKESNIPKWLLHGQSNPNNLNFINTLRRTMNMVETVPVPATAIQSKVDIGIQSDMHYLHVPNSLPYSNAAEAASSGGQLDLDKINELKLKPTTSSSNKSPTPPDSYSSDSGTSKNIPELMSSESPSVISTASKYNLDANSLKMQEMQLQPTNRSHSSNTSNTSSRRTIKKSSRTLFADVSSADQQVNTNSVNSDSSHRVAGGGEHGLIKIIASNSSNFSRDSSTRSNSLSPRVAGIMPDYVVLEESSPERISHSFANYKKNLELTKVQPTTPANGLSLKSRSQTNICDVTIGNPKSPSSGASSARTYRKSPTVMSIRSKSSEDDVPSSMARLTPTQLDAISSTSPKQSLISIRDSIDSIRPHFSSSKPKSQHSCARNGNDDERDASVHRNPKSDDEQQSTVAEEVRSRSSLTDSFLSELASKSAKSKSTVGSVKTFRPEPVQNGVPVQVATTTIVAPPSSDINLKFKAELHLLSDFNSSLVHLLAVEKSINNLSTPNMSSQQPKTVYQNQDTQTSLIAPADANARVTSSPNMTQAQNADSSSIGPLLSEASALSLNQTGFGLDDFSALSVLNGTVSDTTNLHMSTIPELVDDGNTSATGEFRLQFFEQLIKEEDARIDNMKMILKIRERSLLDRTKAELSWLEMRKKQLLETGKLQAATQVRQKQRGVLVHMQNEQHEMQRIKQLQKAASKERKSILVAQRNRIKSQLTDVGDVQSVAVKMKHTSTRHYRQLQHNSSIAERRLPTPLKVIQQTSLTQHHRKSNGTNNTTVSRRSSASTIQSDDLMGFTTSCYESSFSIVNSNTDAASDAKAGIGDIDRASDKGAGESSSSSTRSTRIISEAVQSSDHLNDNGADVEVAVTACSPRSISRAATESSSSSAAESVPSGSDHVADVLAQRRLQATTTTPLVNSDDGDSVPAHVAVEVSDAVNVVAATAAATTRTTVLVSTTAQLADGGRTDSRQTAVAVAATSAAGAIRTSQDGGGLVKHGDKIKRLLLLKECMLQERRKAAEEVLQWQQRLAEEERTVTGLELAAVAVLTDLQTTASTPPSAEHRPSPAPPPPPVKISGGSASNSSSNSIITTDDPAKTANGAGHQFTGRQLNALWAANMSGISATALVAPAGVRFENERTYTLSPAELERFCAEARRCSSPRSRSSGSRRSSGSVAATSSSSNDDERQEVGDGSPGASPRTGGVVKETADAVLGGDSRSSSRCSSADSVRTVASGGGGVNNIINDDPPASDSYTPDFCDPITADEGVLDDEDDAATSAASSEMLSVRMDEVSGTANVAISLKVADNATNNAKSSASLEQSQSRLNEIMTNISIISEELSEIQSIRRSLTAPTSDDDDDQLATITAKSSLLQLDDPSQHDAATNKTDYNCKADSNDINEAAAILAPPHTTISGDSADPATSVIANPGRKYASSDPTTAEHSSSASAKATATAVVSEADFNVHEPVLSHQSIDVSNPQQNDADLTKSPHFEHSPEHVAQSSDETTLHTDEARGITISNADILSAKRLSFSEDESIDRHVRVDEEESARTAVDEESAIESVTTDQDMRTESAKTESVSVSSVKKRVSEILADASRHDGGGGGAGGSKSPRIQDLYVTTYDVVSPDKSPEMVSPSESGLIDDYLSPNFVEAEAEAEELHKQQLAIEQEIKQIQEQQQIQEQAALQYIRPIPNKPPPPYVPPAVDPPSPPPQGVIPTNFDDVRSVLLTIAKHLHAAFTTDGLTTAVMPPEPLLAVAQSPSENCQRDGSDRLKYLFDVCKELALEHYAQFQNRGPSWLQPEESISSWKQPRNAEELRDFLSDRLQVLFGFKKRDVNNLRLVKFLNQRKRDQVDEVLAIELHETESEWTNFEPMQVHVLDQVTEFITMIAIQDSVADFKKIWAKNHT